MFSSLWCMGLKHGQSQKQLKKENNLSKSGAMVKCSDYPTWIIRQVGGAFKMYKLSRVLILNTNFLIMCEYDDVTSFDTVK